MTGTLHPRWVVVIGATLGAVATCLWLGAGWVFPGRAAVRLQPGSPQALQLSHATRRSAAVQPQIARGVSEKPSTSVPVRTEAASAAVRDDSTYLRMLALAVSRADGTEVIRRINSRHEQFVLTPDDPEWGRQTEQALRDFFASRAANKNSGIEITSVSCRSQGCEVQAVVQMTVPGSDSDTAIATQRSDRDPREVLHEISPVGAALQQEDYIGSDLSESDGASEGVGFIVWYRRLGH